MISQEYINLLDSLNPKASTVKDLNESWLTLIFTWSDMLDNDGKIINYGLLKTYLDSNKKSLLNLANIGLGILICKFNQDEHDIKTSMIELHKNKNAGYSGMSHDPWLNFRAIESFGYSASVGCLTRLCDKFARLTNLMENPELEKVDEKIEDTLQDFIAYCLILICLLGE